MKKAFLMIEMILILSALIVVLNLVLSVFSLRQSAQPFEFTKISKSCEVLCAIEAASR